MTPFMTDYYYAEGHSRCHRRDDCPEGTRIPAHERIQGLGGLPVCEQCTELDNAESPRNPPGNLFMGG